MELTPQTDYQKQMIQILLAKMQQRDNVEYKCNNGEWCKDLNHNEMFLGIEYRLPQKTNTIELIPQNDHQKQMIQILLAKIRSISTEFIDNNKWVKSELSDILSLKRVYRIRNSSID